MVRQGTNTVATVGKCAGNTVTVGGGMLHGFKREREGETCKWGKDKRKSKQARERERARAIENERSLNGM